MVAPVNPGVAANTIFRLLYPTTPSTASVDGDFLSGVATRLSSRLIAADDARAKLSQFAAATAGLSGAKGADLFDQRRAVSDAPTAVRAVAKAGATPKRYTVAVSQIAQAQQIQSDRLSDAAAAVAPGAFRFAVTVAGKTTQVDVTTAAGDTNATVLGKVAAAITRSGAGVKAEVVAGDAPGTSRLQLTSGATGTAATVGIGDTNGALAHQLGLRTDTVASASGGGISRQAQNAVYRLDGGPAVTSQSNEVAVDQGKVAITLTGTTGADAGVSVGVDPNAVGKALGDFVSTFNDVQGYVTSVGSRLPNRVALSLQGFVAAHASQLDAVGVSRQADGTLQLDNVKLNAALTANPEHVATAFSDPQTGLSREGRLLSTTLQRTLTGDATANARQLGQVYTRQQLGNSYNLLGGSLGPVAALLQAGAFNERA